MVSVKMVTKSLSLLLCAVIAATAFVSCDSDKDSKKKRKNDVTESHEYSENEEERSSDTKRKPVYSEGTVSESAEDPADAEYELGEEIYYALVVVNSVTDDIASYVYDAWYFAVYKSDDIPLREDGMDLFAETLHIDEDLAEAAVTNYLSYLGYSKSEIDTVAKREAISNISDSTNIALYVYELSSGIACDEIDEALSGIKANLKTMSSTYEERTGLSMLKKTYNDISDYYEFVVNPRCSFNQYSERLGTYKQNICSDIGDLEFIYD